MELFHNVADQMTALAQQLAKQGEVLQELRSPSGQEQPQQQ